MLGTREQQAVHLHAYAYPQLLNKCKWLVSLSSLPLFLNNFYDLHYESLKLLHGDFAISVLIKSLGEVVNVCERGLFNVKGQAYALDQLGELILFEEPAVVDVELPEGGSELFGGHLDHLLSVEFRHLFIADTST